MSKFYAFKGEENRIFTDWNECREYMTGKKGYEYKSFSTREEAAAYLNGKNYYDELIAADIAAGYAVAYTDGSYDEGVGKYSYGAIVTKDGKNFTELSGFGSDGEFLPSRNIAGEVSGVIEAARWAVMSGVKRLKIYHDYAGLALWQSGEWRVSSPVSRYYKNTLRDYIRAVDIHFIKVGGHTNDKYNDKVDLLAKRALFDGVTLEFMRGGRFFTLAGDVFANEIADFVYSQERGCSYSIEGGNCVFRRNDEILTVGTNMGVTVVSGDYAVGFAFAIKKAMELSPERTASLLECAYGVEFCIDEDLNGYNISDKLIEKCPETDCTSYIVFTLEEVYARLTELLKSGGFAVERASQAFKREGEVFKLKEENSRISLLAEKLFNFYYKQRMRAANAGISAADAAEIVNAARAL